jgi:ribosome recycling factor
LIHYKKYMAYDFSKLQGQIKETGEWLERELGGVRTGRATPSVLDSVRAEVYGSRTPLSSLASIMIEDSRTLRIVPWDKEAAKPIEKAIGEADLGISVAVDDAGLRVLFPSLTAERRVELGKIAGERLEQAKITLRGHRAEALKDLDAKEKEGGMGKDDVARLKADVQKYIDSGTDTLEALTKKKQDDITKN